MWDYVKLAENISYFENDFYEKGLTRKRTEQLINFMFGCRRRRKRAERKAQNAIKTRS